jgi:hypothetical protein
MKEVLNYISFFISWLLSKKSGEGQGETTIFPFSTKAILIAPFVHSS